MKKTGGRKSRDTLPLNVTAAQIPHKKNTLISMFSFSTQKNPTYGFKIFIAELFNSSALPGQR